MRDDLFWRILVVVGLFVLALLFGYYRFLDSSDEARVKTSLEVMGFKDVEVGEAHFFTSINHCASEDAAAVEAMATNSEGKRVKVMACCSSIFKEGCTVRSY